MANLFDKLAGNLLDLGLRNRLLNFKDQKLRSIEIIEPGSGDIFSLFNSDSLIYFAEPHVEEEDEEISLFDEEETEEEPSLETNEVIAYKKTQKYDYILKHLQKFNDSAKIERGVNILYVSFGMLNWKEADYSKYDLKSPLLLIPVTLAFDKSRQQYFIKKVEDEVIVNPALKSKLDIDFKIPLPEFIADEDDIESYLSKVEEILPDEEWIVEDKVYLGIFSFSKITMYNDLKVNEDDMSESPLIKAIYNGDESEIQTHFDTDYDEFFEKDGDVKLVNVVDADSSQIEAILEAKKGKSFVIQGPPGTGKSQTITNIIAELINDGKKVLFVSEKKAALDVVYKNLKRVGLDDFCFQVHSDKMNKKEFVSELYRVLHASSKGKGEREAKLRELLEKKHKLDTYCRTLNQNIDSLNISVRDLFNAVYIYKKHKSLTFKIPDIETKNLDYLVKCKSALERLASYTGSFDYSSYTWFGFNADKYNYSNGDEIYNIIEWSKRFVEQIKVLATYLSDVFGKDYSTVEAMSEAAKMYAFALHLPYHDQTLFNKSLRKRMLSSFEDLVKVYSAIEETQNSLNSVFTEDIYNVNIEDYKNRFINNYRSIFRIFNKSYKSDVEDLSKYLSNTDKKANYKTICKGLKSASNLVYLKNRLSDKLVDCSKLSEFKYDLADRESLTKVVTAIKEFDNNYPDLDITIDKPISIKEFIGNVQKLSELFTDDNLLKYDDFKSYFITNYFDFNNSDFSFIINKVDSYLADKDGLIQWVRFFSVWFPIEQLNLVDFIKYTLDKKVNKEDLADAFSYCFYNNWLMFTYYENDELKYFRRSTQDLTIKQFKHLDKELLEADRKAVAYTVRNRLHTYVDSVVSSYTARYSSVPYEARKELSILEHEANKKRAIKPIRVMFKEIPNLIYRIKPCLLMSPLSVATYLKYAPEAFDVVIFDEASQIFPWDAIGAISRSKATIVVGDSKQMPPTNFFMASAGFDDDYDEEEEESATDYESILDLCTAVLPQKMLNWHYRSKTESLIAFSNRNFYQNKLITFPSSQHDSDDFGIKFHYVKNGVFNNRQNVNEANMVADLIFEHFKKHPERSLGVVCFSINQQMLLEDVIDERRRRGDPYAKFFDQTIDEPFFVKNLETVQGDERDTIIFSIGYGKDSAGNLKHHFGPLNRKGGERRLNVAITRAKYNIQVVSSIRSFDIDLNRTKAEGARLLKEYLDLAENGLSVLNKDLVLDENLEAESAFEEDVASVIREAGYNVDLQVGCSGYRIDLCVKHPKNNDYVLAVECDGKTYHSSKNARDRDRLRQEVLERLGWKFYRIWSTDWFINRDYEKQALLKRINEAVLEYDLEAKKIEERNKIIADDRYKDVTSSSIRVVPESKKKASADEDKFTDSLTKSELEYLNIFNDELKKSKYNFVFDERPYIFAYKLKSDVDEGKARAWFWIGKAGNHLIFKIKNDPGDFKASKEFKVGKPGGAVELAKYVLNICDERFKSTFEVIKSPEIVTVSSDGDVVLKRSAKGERFLFLISRAIEGRRVNCSSMEESKVINEVLEYVMNEISYDAVSKGYFKDKQEFEECKYLRRYTYSLHKITFTLGNVSNSKALDIYYYFIAAKVIDVIKSYEKIFNEKIVVNYLGLINFLRDLIRAGDDTYYRSTDITSSFSLVPEAVIEETVNKYLEYIK